MRADQLLVHRGLAVSRSQAARLIANGARWLDYSGWRELSKSDELPDDARIEFENRDEAKYVSRGGLKLQGALKATGLNVEGLLCLDVGQSTGGFTDCLLHQRAMKVIGVDVGHSQLHQRLRSDSRVVCIERVNARSELTAALDRTGAPWRPEFACMDVSFISQTLIVEQLHACLSPKANVLALVKPQFELQPDQLAKGGLVKDASLYDTVQARITSAYAAAGFEVCNYFDSAITGGDGNREFFVHVQRG
jgi:23S rRNA (cytidine1920-2'-O)/16S rRNA (cytidine1409-2'-O)-methyltransferase